MVGVVVEGLYDSGFRWETGREEVWGQSLSATGGETGRQPTNRRGPRCRDVSPISFFTSGSSTKTLSALHVVFVS